MATAIPLRKGLFAGLLLVLSACQPRLLVPLYDEPGDTSSLPPLPAYKGINPISFCQLPAFQRQVVYVRGRYTSDNNESSDFEPLEVRNPTEPPCLGAVELTIPGYDQLAPLIKAKFTAMHRLGDHRTQYLLVDAIGQYDQDDPGGYGHLGYHKGQFVVRELVQVTHVVVKQRKGRRILLVD